MLLSCMKLKPLLNEKYGRVLYTNSKLKAVTGIQNNNWKKNRTDFCDVVTREFAIQFWFNPVGNKMS